MPSVRVRRSSQYVSIRGEDGTRDDTQRRPRSRTLASIYRPPGQASSESSQSDAAIASPIGQDDADADLSRGSTAQFSRVADSILYGSAGPSHPRRYTSNELLNGQRADSLEPERRRAGATITFEGSQADVVVPDDGKGPGILERSLSLSSDASDPFQNSAEHEDDIVEHLDVIGTMPPKFLISSLTFLQIQRLLQYPILPMPPMQF